MKAETIIVARNALIERVIDQRGIKLRGKIERVGPCPKCGGTDRFAVNIKKQMWNCRGCQQGGDVIALVQFLDGVEFREACAALAAGETGGSVGGPRNPRREPDTDNYERQQRRKADWLWQQSETISSGCPAEIYLRQVRGYRGPIPATLAYLPPAKPEHHPAMVAAFAFCDEPAPGVLGAPYNVDAIHLTLLRPDGCGKATVERPKLFVGRPLARPIVIAPVNDLGGLAITEGIEDSLTAQAATGLGAWAAGAAGFMPALADVVPAYVEAVTIFSHADQAGQAGAVALAEKLHAGGVEVFIERCAA